MSKPPALPWLAWWPADYLGATRAMTIAERGAYIDLLNYSWLNGPLPHEPDRLARMIGVTPQEFAAVWPMIRPKFEVTPHGLVNNRMERERQIAIANQGKRSDKASKAAGARWGTSDAQSSAPSINSRPASDAPSNARSNGAATSARSVRNGTSTFKVARSGDIRVRCCRRIRCLISTPPLHEGPYL